MSDLVRSLPGLLLVAFLPGFLLATVCAPRWSWWLRAALAPGLAGGMVGLAGLLYHDLHVRFTVATAVPMLVFLAGTAVVRVRGAHPRPAMDDLSGRATALLVGCALAAGAATVAAMAAGFHDLPVPFETDAPVHGEVTAAIARTGDAVPVLREPVTRSTWERPRTGFEATAALVAEVGGPSPALTMLPVAAVSVLLLPLGLAALAWETTRSRRIARLTPLLAVILPFPTFPVIFGEFPLVMDSTLVAGMVLAAVYAVRGWASRDCLAMTVALVASVWVIHGTEVLTAVVIGAPLVLGMLWGLGRSGLRPAAWRLAGFAAACVAGAALVTVLTRQPALISPAADGLGGPAVSGPARFLGSIAQRRWVDLEFLFRSFVFPAQWVIVLWLVGIAAALLTRTLRWALVAQLLMLTSLADVVVTGRLSRLWQAVFPWSTDDRLMSIQFWVLPTILALGAVWAVDGLLRALPRTPRTVMSGVALAAVAGVCAAPGIGRMGDQYTAEKAARAAATRSDVAVLARLGDVLPPGSTVLTDGLDDAGQWVGALTPDVGFFSTEYARAHTDDARIVALSRACDDPAGAADVLGGVDAVFVGAARIATTPHPWSLRCLAEVPGLRRVAQTGDSAAFVVERR